MALIDYIEHKFLGMVRDVSLSDQVDTKRSKEGKTSMSNYYYDSMNFRLSATEANTSGVLVSERGNKILKINSKVFEVKGIPVGVSSFKDSSVIFYAATDDGKYAEDLDIERDAEDLEYEDVVDAMMTENEDSIYHMQNVNGDIIPDLMFHSDDLNFSSRSPMETIPYFETGDIKKVYWIDRHNQPRLINVSEDIDKRKYWIPTSFDFAPYVNMLKTSIDVGRYTEEAGLFTPGSIQYVFTYFNEHMQETSIIGKSRMLYTSFNDRGGSKDDTVSNSFMISIMNPDTNYDFIRLYSIHRDVKDSIPDCRHVADIHIDKTINYVDKKDVSLSGIYPESVTSIKVRRNDSSQLVDARKALVCMEGYGPKAFTYPSYHPALVSAMKNETYKKIMNLVKSTGKDDRFPSESVNGASPASVTDLLDKYSSLSLYRDYNMGSYSYTRYCIEPSDFSMVKINDTEYDLSEAEYFRLSVYNSGKCYVETDGRITSCRRMEASMPVYYVDNNLNSTAIDYNELLSKGCERFISETFDYKDNILFFGNIRTMNYSLDDSFKESLKDSVRSRSYSPKDVGKMPSHNQFYPWESSLGKPANMTRTFKYMEKYRFGVQFQDNTGRWSEAIWLGDEKNTTIYPGYGMSSGNMTKCDSDMTNLTLAQYKIKFGTHNLFNYARRLGYVNVRPVVVYPNYSERLVLAQGVVNPTVFNCKDRYDSNCHVQNSWFFRPNPPLSANYEGAQYDYTQHYDFKDTQAVLMSNDINYKGVLGVRSGYVEDENIRSLSYPVDKKLSVLNGSWIEFRHNFALPSNTHRNCEIQGSEGEGYETIESYTPARYSDLVFGVDKSIVTLNSPDIEFDDSSMLQDMSGVKFRIIGMIPITTHSSDIYIETSTPPGCNDLWKNSDKDDGSLYVADNGVYMTCDGLYRRMIYSESPTPYAFKMSCMGGYWEDELIMRKWYYDAAYTGWSWKTMNNSNGRMNQQMFAVYPWQIDGSLRNQSSADDDNVFRQMRSELKRKILSNQRVSYNTIYFDNSDFWNAEYTYNNNTYRGVSDICVVDSEFDTLTKFKAQNENGYKSYYGNIDKAYAAKNGINRVTIGALYPDEDVSKQKMFCMPAREMWDYYAWKTSSDDIGLTGEFEYAYIQYKEASGSIVETGGSYRVYKENDTLLSYFNTWVIEYTPSVQNNSDQTANISSFKITQYDTKERCVEVGAVYIYSNGTGFVIKMRLKKSGRVFKTDANKYVRTAGAIQISYKSTRHALIPFSDTANGLQRVLPTMYAPYRITNNSSEGKPLETHIGNNVCNDGVDEHTNFWNGPIKVSRQLLSPYLAGRYKYPSISDPIMMANYRIFYGYLYLGELYRDNDDMIYGGTDKEALYKNNWEPCGDVVSIINDDNSTKSQIELVYDEGDTFYQRYDCMKTAPYSEESMNSIVEILSFNVETRINLDGRYDKRRGEKSNIYDRPSNFNLINDVYSQRDNFFSYKTSMPYMTKETSFPNQIAWSKLKKPGSDVDIWTNMNLGNTMFLNGSVGKINRIINHNDNLFSFQDNAITKIKYNDNVAIPTESGMPIELANSKRVDGYDTLYNNLGCQNKWSVLRTKNNLYFIDDKKKAVYSNDKDKGFVEISDTKLMHSYFNDLDGTEWNPVDQANYKLIYDDVNKEVMFTKIDDCLVFNEMSELFVGRFSYDKVPYMFSIDNDNYQLYTKRGRRSYIYEYQKGEYNHFFDKYRPQWLTFITNEENTDKTFDNAEFTADTYDGMNILNDVTFDKIHCWNEHQDSGETDLTFNHLTSSNLKKKYRIWRANIPRDSGSRNRMRNPWLFVKFIMDSEDSYKTILQDLKIYFTK